MDFLKLFDSFANSQYHNIDIFEIENAFSKINHETFLLFDIFPEKINNATKYDQVSVFFQKYLDKIISKKIFLQEEEKIVKLITHLWTCNSTYAVVNLYVPLDKNHPAKKCKKELLCYKRSKIETNTVFQVQSLELLKSLILIGTREIGIVYLFFYEYRIAIELSGIVGLIWCDDKQKQQKFIQLAYSCLLFTRYPDLD